MSLPLVCIKREHCVANVHGYRSSIYHLIWCCPNSKGIWCPVASLNTAYLYWKLPGRPRYHVNSIVEPLRGRSTNNVHNTNAKHFIHAKQAKRKQKKSTCAGSKARRETRGIGGLLVEAFMQPIHITCLAEYPNGDCAKYNLIYFSMIFAASCANSATFLFLLF